MSEGITIQKSQTLHPEQWVKVYGIFSNRCDYINTCQVYQLEAVLSGIRQDWWDEFILEPVEEEALTF